MQTSTGAARPWYKEPWVLGLIAGPAVVVVAGFITFYLAASTFDGMVSDDYYKQGKEINMQLVRDEHAAQMGLTAQVLVSPDMKTVSVTASSKAPLEGPLLLRLMHPASESFDQTIELRAQGAGRYVGTLKPHNANHWYLRLEDTSGQWRVQGEWRPSEGNAVLLGTPKLEAVEQ